MNIPAHVWEQEIAIYLDYTELYKLMQSSKCFVEPLISLLTREKSRIIGLIVNLLKDPEYHIKWKCHAACFLDDKPELELYRRFRYSYIGKKYKQTLSDTYLGCLLESVGDYLSWQRYNDYGGRKTFEIYTYNLCDKEKKSFHEGINYPAKFWCDSQLIQRCLQSFHNKELYSIYQILTFRF